MEEDRKEKNKKKKQMESLWGSQLTWVSQAKALDVGQPVTGEWLRYLKITRKKNRRHQIFNAGVEPPETDMSSLWHQAEVRR